MKNSGFSIVEIIVAMGIFLIIAVSAVTTILGSFSTNRLGEEETSAYLFALEGIEAAKSIRNQGWGEPFLVNNCSSGCGIINNSGSWSWSGNSNTLNKFSRVITVSDVQRNGSGTIVASGGTNDPNTKKVTSSVTWDFTPTRTNTVSLSTYLTNFLKPVVNLWSGITNQGGEDISGTFNALKVESNENFAYVITENTANPDFFIIDISNPSNPVVTGTLDVNGNNLDIFGNYVFVTSNDTSALLKTIDVTNPSNPVQIASNNQPGNASALGVDIEGNYLYMTRANSNRNEFYIFNISNPTNLNEVGNLNLTGNPREVVVVGSYAYVASDNDNQELQVINISNPNSPSLVNTVDLPGAANAISIDGSNVNLVMGGDGNGSVHIFDLVNPTSPSLLGTYTANASVNDLVLGNNNTYAFLATSDNAQEFQVISIANTSNPSLIGTFDTSDILNGVSYIESLGISIVVGNNDNEELTILTSQ